MILVQHFPPGELPSTWWVGDYILTHNTGVFPTLIRFGQALRFRGDRKKFAYWSHAVWVSRDWLYEALSDGVHQSPMEKYRDRDFHYVQSNLTEAERWDADEFVRWAYKQHTHYGYPTIVSIGLSLLTGLKFSFGVPGTVICSGLVAAALGAPQWREDPSHVLPADLAEYAEILP